MDAKLALEMYEGDIFSHSNISAGPKAPNAAPLA